MKSAFLKTTSVSLITLLAAACSRGAATKANTLYTFESDANGFNTKTFFYDNGEEVVAFDAQLTLDLARQALTYLHTKSKHPVTFLVVTGPNPDKFNGLTAFQKDGVKVVASKATESSLPDVDAYKRHFFVDVIKIFTESSYPPLGQPDITFSGAYDLRLRNGESVVLRELSQPAASSTQTIALLPAVNAAIVGDLVHHKAHAWLGGGIVGGKAKLDVQGWMSDLNELEEILQNAPGTEVYGGRGDAASVADAVKTQRAYLVRAQHIVDEYVNRLGAGRSELGGPEASSHYLALQKEFEAAFPDYAFGYMIQYGVSGLVNAEMDRSKERSGGRP